MLLEYVFHTGKRIEMTKEDFNSLGKKKRLFKVIDEKDSPKIKQQIISNQIGTGAKIEKPSTGEATKSAPVKNKSKKNES